MRPLACVIGTMDLVRPLGLAGIRSAVVSRPGARVRFSRFAVAAVDWIDPWKQPEDLVERLLAFAAGQNERPVLYYEGDWDLLMVSRFRDRLREGFRFVVPDAELVEDLVDKDRFAALAERLELPVPRSRRLSAVASPSDLDLRLPLVVKPLTRQLATWDPIGERAKAVQVETAAELRSVWARLAAGGVDGLAQESVPGPETLIESYHAYVDETGEIVGDFTGRKIRTRPPAFGYSTALVTTASEDVAALGRDLVRRLNLHGVAKLDFKRASDGSLRLLEVNPRFNLWHHVGAKAGVNLPALVYGDLAGLPRPRPANARPGVRWFHARDARAAREAGIPLTRWIPWALGCEAKSAIAWDDPMPVLGATLWRLGRRLRSPGSSRPEAALDAGA